MRMMAFSLSHAFGLPDEPKKLNPVRDHEIFAIPLDDQPAFRTRTQTVDLLSFRFLAHIDECLQAMVDCILWIASPYFDEDQVLH